MNRREFLLSSGTGLFVVFTTSADAFQEPARIPSRMSYPTDFNAYLHIDGNGRTTCFTGKVELGQGAETALAQLLAEELDVAYDSIDMVMGDTDRCPYDMGTFGSTNIRQFGPVLRRAGAEAKAVLLQLAAEKLGVAGDRLTVKAGTVTAPSGAAVTYGSLVQGKRIERHLENVPVKPAPAHAVIGQAPRRKDAIAKVTGQAKYAGDFRPSGMLYARIVRPPAHGATLRSVDTAQAEKAGARVVRDGTLVAVLHERPDLAESALRQVTAQFDQPPSGPDDQTIFEHLLKTAPQPTVVHQAGSLTEGEKLVTGIVDQTYLNSYVSHAPVETHSAVATFESGKLTVWVSTQAPFSVKQQVAQAAGLPPEKVRIVTPYVGGGFGGKSAAMQAAEAARLAKATGKPVHVAWSRAEEFFYDTFRPAAVVKIRSGTTSAGKIALWDYQVVGAGDREARQFYDIPNQKTTSAGGWQGGNPPGMHPFSVGPWRAPSVNTNTFARESHIDILAARAGVDPLTFRLNHLSDPRMRQVLQTAAERFGWKPAKAPSGRGIGVACGIYSGTYVATLAEIAVNRTTGRVQVRRIVTAQDQGLIVNPDGSRQQMEGSITMGLGQALTEEVRFRNGEVLDRNFDTYEIPRFSWVPKIETILIPNREAPASGCGEPPIVTVAAVIANAVYDSVGARLLQLPMTPARVQKAIKA